MSEYCDPIGHVTESTPSTIRVEISDAKEFEKHKRKLGIGQYLLIASGNNSHLLSTITAIRASQADKAVTLPEAPGGDADETEFRFQVEAQPIGSLSSDGEFIRGSHSLPVPTEPAFITPAESLANIFTNQIKSPFTLGSLSIAPDIYLKVDGDRFFSKHVAVVGSDLPRDFSSRCD